MAMRKREVLQMETRFVFMLLAGTLIPINASFYADPALVQAFARGLLRAARNLDTKLALLLEKEPAMIGDKSHH
jgi:hypothetical protein